MKAVQQVRIYSDDYQRFRKHGYELEKSYPELITHLLDHYEQCTLHSGGKIINQA